MIDMCASPIKLPNGFWVACKRCNWCKGNRVNDFAGRCVAEQQTSSGTLSLTLTYADSVSAGSLFYKDIQRMLYHLRADGYSVRYVCCGEYGEKKGRAHWHLLLFFKGEMPEFELASRFRWKYWKHGLAYAQFPDFDGIAYILKYTLKDDTSRAFHKVLRLSKYPPIGHDYFQQLAQRLVDARLAMQSPEYSFAHCRLRTGVMRKFWLTGASRRDFLKAYVTKWREATGAEPPKHEFLWEEYFDPIARDEKLLSESEFAEYLSKKPVVVRPPEVLDVVQQIGFLLLPDPHGGLISAYSDGTARLVGKDGRRWRQVLGDGKGNAGIIAELRRAGFSDALSLEVHEWLNRRFSLVRSHTGSTVLRRSLIDRRAGASPS